MKKMLGINRKNQYYQNGHITKNDANTDFMKSQSKYQ